VAGRIVAGRVVAGRIVAGRVVAGRIVAGRAVAGRVVPAGSWLAAARYRRPVFDNDSMVASHTRIENRCFIRKTGGI